MPFQLQLLLDSPWVLGSGIAIVVVAIILVSVLRQPTVFRAFNSGGGEVLVRRKAVKELVQHCCNELGSVGSAQAKVFLRGGEIRVHVELRVLRNANVKGMSSYLRQQITVALTENLGIEKLGDIEILVVGVLDKTSKEE